LRSALATKQADFNLHIDKLKRELTELGTTKEKVITDQRALIDQLSNSMSEAATQLMDSQNTSKYHQTDIETRDRRITALEEKIVWLEDNVRDRTDRLIEQEDASKELSKRIDQLIREKEIILAQLDGAMDDLTQKAALIDSMESQRKKSDLIQTNLVSELQSLPIINKRLESDCAFLREDLKAVSEKLKGVLKDHELLSARLKIVDSILSPEQRLRVNERSTGPLVKSEASAVSENKRLQIEAMELRMRLVDSQAARDKAQSQLIDQSQLIAKLQKDLRYPGDENVLLRNK
jgi:regulator of replication initiation timing